MRSSTYRRAGFSLLELLLSLALIVLATALIGSLMQLYARNFMTRGDDIRREQLARAILNMIGEDIRSVVLAQEYDATVLEQLLGAGGGGGGGGGGAAGGQGAAAGGSSLASSSLGDPAADATTADMMGAGDMSTTVSTSYPPGIYGDQYTLMVDVSRIPRPDEYIMQPTSLLDGSLTDVPGDMKTVTYYIQTETNQGVSDQLATFADPTQATGMAGGLVRRQLDRGVTAYAEEIGDTMRLLRTGDLVAPEVISIEFSYFDGIQWLLEWDSSTQSLPWLIQISLAMQSATGSERAWVEAGTPISTLTYDDRAAYGIKVYQLVVAIPGAQLVAADAVSEDQAAGMESMGL